MTLIDNVRVLCASTSQTAMMIALFTLKKRYFWMPAILISNSAYILYSGNIFQSMWFL